MLKTRSFEAFSALPPKLHRGDNTVSSFFCLGNTLFADLDGSFADVPPLFADLVGSFETVRTAVSAPVVERDCSVFKRTCFSSMQASSKRLLILLYVRFSDVPGGETDLKCVFSALRETRITWLDDKGDWEIRTLYRPCCTSSNCLLSRFDSDIPEVDNVKSCGSLFSGSLRDSVPLASSEKSEFLNEHSEFLEIFGMEVPAVIFTCSFFAVTREWSLNASSA